MKRAAWNLLIDFLAAVCFVGMIATGYILRFPLPPGSNKSLMLWGLGRHQWGDVHFWISLALLVVLWIHLVLHWQWVVSIVAKQFGAASSCQPGAFRAGIAAVIVMGTFAWWAKVSVAPRRGDCCPRIDAANSVSPERLPAAEGAFPSDVHALLAARCFSCHSGDMAQGGFRADRRESFFGNGESTAWIVPGNASGSRLLSMLSSTNAAPFHRLVETEMNMLRAWIDNGAAWPEP